MKTYGKCGECCHWKATGTTLPASFEDYIAQVNIAREQNLRLPLPEIEAKQLRSTYASGRLGTCERRLHTRKSQRHQPVMIEHGGCGEWTPTPAPEHLPNSCAECRFFVAVQGDEKTILRPGAGMCGAFAPSPDGQVWPPRPPETKFVFPYTEADWRCGDGVSVDFEEDVL